MADSPFLGTGIAFPFQADPGGAVLLRASEALIEQSMVLILSTRPGERPMRPLFGCAVHSQVFSPSASPRTIAAVTRAVQESLERWEPRIDVLSVHAMPKPDLPSVLEVDIEYRIKSTNDVRNLVYPFYSIPPESGASSEGSVR